MIDPMKESTEHALVCMPWPAHVGAIDESVAARVGLAPTTFRYLGVDDPRVREHAEQVLGDHTLGLIEIDISGKEFEPLPSVSMDESYRLSLAEDAISLATNSVWGALRGLATLAQLARHGQLFAGLTIEDRPRFPWRGLLLDVSRHFFPVQSLMSVIDGLAALKMNVLHLHLSDDQACRFPSAAFPKLASDEHYSIDELRGLVCYAADRGVRVIPELDMPGHVTSWLTAYPEWGSEPTTPSLRFGVHQACLNPLNENVYDAISILLSELADVFPDDYVHVGGDEVSSAWWRRDPIIAAYLEDHEMTTHDLQNAFLVRVCAMVRKLGKQPIGWDEILHPDMPDCVVQNWRGATTRDRALALSKPTLVSAPYYLDLHYPADIHYGFDPETPQSQWLEQEDALQGDPRLRHVADGIEWTKQWRVGKSNFAGEVAGAVNVMGGEACLWAELVDPAVLATRLWSRLPAVAERLWSPASCTDVDSMYRRLQACWLSLPEEPELTARRHLHEMGFSADQISLLALLEPVKWYGRLLGEQALRARLAGSEMPKARPYQADTPLDRVADFLPPESMAARRLDELTLLDSATRVKDLMAGWPDGKPKGELSTVLAALEQGADVLLSLESDACTLADARQRLSALDVSYGEYIAAPLTYWHFALDSATADVSERPRIEE